MWLDRRLRQRIVGASVLIALAATFLPMFLSREGARPPVAVAVPPMPAMPAMPNMATRPAQVPEPITPPNAPVATKAVKGAATAVPSPESHLDANGLPISWAIQLVSLSSRASADALVQKLRSQGYSAYVRTVDGMNRVFVGPLVEKAEAARLRDQLQQQQQLNGFVVRFQPERG